ncbi:hypothetical protein ACIBH1_05370 [Nonomuraea sp. NPDC050663]
MAKVRIGVKGSHEPIEVKASKEDEAYYDNLPFTSDNVLWTEVTPDR